MRPGRLLLLALTLAMAPTASAAMGQFHGTAALPWVVEGEHAARSDDGAFLLRGDIGDTDLAMSAEAGRLTRIVTRAYAMASHDDPRAEVLWGGRVDTHELPLAGATLRLAARQPSFVALLHEGPVQLHGGADGALALDLVGERLEVRHEPSAALRIQVDPAGAPFAKSFPASWLKQASSAGVASLASGSAMLTGGTFVLEAADGKRHEFEAFRRTEERPGSIYNPLTRTWSGPGTHRELVDERLVLEGFRGRLDVAFTGIQGLLLAPRADIDVLGTLTLPGARGQVSLEDGENVHTHELAGTTLQLDGRFVARSEQPDAAAGRARLTATGDIRTVSYGTVVADYGWSLPAAAAAVGFGALLLAGAAWAASNGKAVLGIGGAGAIAGYARVHGTEVLEHPGRASVYQRVQADPGVSFTDLAQGLGMSESTLTYHVRVLEKNGFLTLVKEGRSLRLFDRQDAHYARDRKHAAATLRNTTTAAIAQRIARSPGVAQCDLAQEFGLAPSTVNWHIKRLQQVGLVEARRQAPHTRYFLGQAWATLPAPEQQRFGVQLAAA